MNTSRPTFSLPWIALLLGAAALFIAVTQPRAGEADALPVPSAAICTSAKS
jgi:hypothetical protein